LSASVQDSYNMISVDGDTSTNDTCLVLANGLAGNAPITDESSEAYALFTEALNAVNKKLARKMAADGEGASALIEMKVKGAASVEEAKIIAKSVIGSSLVKTAVAGHDANWGRILCAMGYSGETFDPEKVDLYFDSAAGSLKIIENGVDTGYSEDLATRILSQKEIMITADLKQGDCEATAWGCDLTHAYISINADYRS
jgi:glutamate N-acetyltransferase/amino-acid N-acetyltransferase